ncbi:MAG: tetratricopeptide repeat protein [Bacteroidetes bacterium]|nr:tetratricopeptide repeat protein [Bacteroidota bacterium]
MRNLKAAYSLAIVFFGASFLAQQTKETVKSGNVENQMTVSGTGMYKDSESKEAQELFNQATILGDKQDYKNAEKLYLKALKADPKYVEAYDNLGLTYRRMGEYDKAIDNYKRSIELFPEGQTAHQNLAAIYGIKQDYKSADKEYKAMLKNSPNDPEAYFGLANSSMMQSSFDDALVNAKKALELYEAAKSPLVNDGQYMVGLIYYYKSDKENAIKYLKMAKQNGAKIHPKVEKDLGL